MCRPVSKHLETTPAAELARSERQAACATCRVPRDVREALCHAPTGGTLDPPVPAADVRPARLGIDRSLRKTRIAP